MCFSLQSSFHFSTIVARILDKLFVMWEPNSPQSKIEYLETIQLQRRLLKQLFSSGKPKNTCFCFVFIQFFCFKREYSSSE